MEVNHVVKVYIKTDHYLIQITAFFNEMLLHDLARNLAKVTICMVNLHTEPLLYCYLQQKHHNHCLKAVSGELTFERSYLRGLSFLWSKHLFQFRLCMSLQLYMPQVIFFSI